MLANKNYHSVSFAFCGYFLEYPWKKTKIVSVNFQKPRHNEIIAGGGGTMQHDE